MDPKPKILLHGSGAIGTIYLYLLLQSGCDVTAVCRSNYDAVKANGFTIDSERYGKGIQIHPNAVRTPAEAASNGPFDYIIVTAKSIPDAQTSKVIEPAVTEGKTGIVLIQNGVGIEAEFTNVFPQNPILSCVVYLPATQSSPGHIQMGNFESLEVGTYPDSAYTSQAGVKDSADRFMQILGAAGSKATFHADVQENRWKKLLLNASWNPICALTLSRDVAFLASSPSAASLVEEVMQEVVAIANALGYSKISATTALEQVKRAKDRVGTKGIEPSMLVDILWGRRMEVEAILGEPVRLAKRHRVPVSKLETLYVVTKALDEAVALRSEGQSLGGDETRKAREAREARGEAAVL